MVSHLIHPLPGCMHLFASVGQIKVVAPKAVPVRRHPASNDTNKASTQADKNNGTKPAQMSSQTINQNNRSGRRNPKEAENQLESLKNETKN